MGESTSNSLDEWLHDHVPEMKGIKAGSERGTQGSGWSSTQLVETNSGGRLFIKTARLSNVSMFRGEAVGLEALAATDSIRIPSVYGYGTLTGSGKSFIVMEGLDIQRLRDQSVLGRKLAALHLSLPHEGTKFGFQFDNTIGATPQINSWRDSWIDFWIENRLLPQIKMAADLNELSSSQVKFLKEGVDQIIPNLGKLFAGIDVQPSLIHGDFWSGNIASVDGQPTLFDPACYYGHHEAEFGMSWCAGLNTDFWRGYRELIPKEPGWEERNKLYTLYHNLNHLNLFGGSYYSESAQLIADLKQVVK